MSHITPDQIRTRFSRAMSDMYRREVPQYGTLLKLVSDINAIALHEQPALRRQLAQTCELDRLEVERHGAIRLGTAQELAMMRRVFAVMGMLPVGYYDLSVAGVPVHSTAFRPVSDEALSSNPFRVFTSLLRLELIEDKALRAEASSILARRHIFSERLVELTGRCEAGGGLDDAEANEFVVQALETFRWHNEATVDRATYDRLHDAHRLIADVVCFKGPHINHLTPRTLDIDAAQAAMPERGIMAKETIEGPPRRRCPILLRQTSFKALEERIAFQDEDAQAPGTHTARFGEIEQRGVALTRRGRALYDELLARHRDSGAPHAGLAAAFADFPDEHDALRRAGLAFFRYAVTATGLAAGPGLDAEPIEALVSRGLASFEPITYEDFLPVSAAGIFQSNLGGTEAKAYEANAAQQVFELALDAAVIDEIGLYEAAQQRSIDAVRAALAQRP